MTKFYNHITEDEKIKLARITQDCVDTHVFNPPKAFVSLAVLDRDGNEIERHELLSKSWVRNFYNILLMGMTGADTADGTGLFGPGGLAWKSTAGSTNNVAVKIPYIFNGNGNQDHIFGGAGITTKGIVVGSSAAAESFDSHILGSLIPSGNASNQLAYAAQAAPVYSYDSGLKKATVIHERFFNNNSGAPIGVKEVGLYSQIWYDGSSSQYALINRDTLPSTVEVPNGGQLKVNYIFELVYPA